MPSLLLKNISKLYTPDTFATFGTIKEYSNIDLEIENGVILKIIETSPLPLVIDADALNALCHNLNILTITSTPKILTPHPGEMSRLTKEKKETIEKNREDVENAFAKK